MAWARVANLLRVGLVTLLLAFELSTAVASGAQPHFAAMYDDPSVFERALAKESLSPPTGHRVTGITVPHHLVAADLTADHPALARSFPALATAVCDVARSLRDGLR